MVLKSTIGNQRVKGVQKGYLAMTFISPQKFLHHHHKSVLSFCFRGLIQRELIYKFNSLVVAYLREVYLEMKA